MDLGALKNILLKRIQHSLIKTTPRDLEKAVATNYGLNRKEVRSALKQLIKEESLTYTNQFGRTFIELSFNKAVRISKQVVLKPPQSHFKPGSGDVVVQPVVHRGGAVDHPPPAAVAQLETHVARRLDAEEEAIVGDAAGVVLELRHQRLELVALAVTGAPRVDRLDGQLVTRVE